MYSWIAARIHHIAYVASRKPRSGSNRLTACIMPTLPSEISSSKRIGLPHLSGSRPRDGFSLLLIGARVDHDMRTFAGQLQRRRTADIAPRSGDQRDLPFELAHAPSPRRCSNGEPDLGPAVSHSVPDPCHPHGLENGVYARSRRDPTTVSSQLPISVVRRMGSMISLAIPYRQIRSRRVGSVARAR